MNNITITVEEYHDLLDRAFKLECLENGGVDNWEWYVESLKPYFKAMDEAEAEKEKDNVK